MLLPEFLSLLQAHPAVPLRFMLPSAELVPAHAHVTEVGYVRKEFVDCGGTRRLNEACVLQLWVANDVEHRLAPGKLAGIIEKCLPILPRVDLPVEVEYDLGHLTHYNVERVFVTADGITILLAGKHAACLAPDRCGVDSGCCDPVPANQAVSLAVSQ